MLPLAIAPGTTIEELVTEVVPKLHAKHVPASAPRDELSMVLEIEGCATWTLTVRGAHMRVEEGARTAPTCWMFTTRASVLRFLQDATGPQRMLPRFALAGGVASITDPRVLKRVAMASGRVELAVMDGGERMAAIFGLGGAARRPIDPEGADVVLETSLGTLERMLHGELGPEEALGDGDVKVRGNRLLALQLALAVAPFYPTKR